MNKTMETKFSLPCDVAELQKMNVDWKTLTNGFDYDTVNRTIKLWKNYGERCMVARMIGSQMSVKNLRDITTSALQPVLDLLNMYRYEEGSREYKLLEGRLKYDEEKSRREKWERLQEENKRLKTQVEKLTDEKNDAVERYESLKKEIENEPREAFNPQTSKKCFSNRQMGILMQAIGELVEQRPPGKTTLGSIVENIAGYSATTVNQNMKGIHREFDKKAVADAIESKFPRLAEKVMKL